MPIRTATLNRQIEKNGAKLHLAMAARAHSHGNDKTASELEQALLDERRALKEENAKRIAAAKAPKVKAVVVRVAKPVKEPKAPKAPKADKEPKVAKTGKDAKAKPTRAEKMTKKAENLDAAKKADKKSAKK